MTGCRVANLVDTLFDGVQRGVIANGAVCAIKVIVDRSGQSDTRKVVFFSQFQGAAQRTVSADNNECIDIFALQGFVGLSATFRCRKSLAASRAQDRAATLYDVADIFCGKRRNIAVDQSVITTINAFDLKTIYNATARHGANSSIHSGCIAA